MTQLKLIYIEDVKMATGRYFSSIILLICIPFAGAQVWRCPYQLSIKTGDLEGAGTNALINIVFGINTPEPYQITDLKNYGINGPHYNYFQRNQLDIFVFDAPCDPRCPVALIHNQRGDDVDWYVEYFSISASLGTLCDRSRLYPLRQWFNETYDAYHVDFCNDDAKTLCPYQVSIKTGDVEGAGAGTNALIYMVFGVFTQNPYEIADLKKYGINGPNYNYFQRNQLDIFVFDAPCVPRCPFRLIKNNTGDDGHWYLEYFFISAALSSGCDRTRMYPVHLWWNDDPFDAYHVDDFCKDDANTFVKYRRTVASSIVGRLPMPSS